MLLNYNLRVSSFLLLLFIACMPVSGFAQVDKARAHQLGEEAVKIMDEGKVDEAILKLQQAQKLDPDNYDYSYEMAYAYNLKKDYPKAIELMKAVVKNGKTNDRCYQMLGNLYDMTGDSTMALKTYKEGLQKYPTSGKLYLEQGNMYYNKEKYMQALPYYEKGIDADPQFPSNYYRAAIIYMSSSERVWGMLYGELFMLLEPNSERTEKMSEMLYKTYGNAITWENDTAMNVSFTKMTEMTPEDVKKGRLPFASNGYEIPMLMAAMPYKSLDYENLCKMRAGFINLYYERQLDKQYPNVLFDFQNRLKKEGLLDMYNHWILSRGNLDQFKVYTDQHKKDWDSFLKWFTENRLKLTDANKFTRAKA